MIDHKHWKRANGDGIQNQHIAIVGYSHYGETSKDYSGFTNWAMKSYISGKGIGERFFPPVQTYFGYEGRPEFWNQVDFFNFVPECFATAKKFASADAKLKDHAQKRFLRILTDEKPDKVFVFTRKGWNQCPPTLEEAAGGRCIPLKFNPEDNWGTYDVGGHRVKVCGFRHPLFYANSEQVAVSVREFLMMK
jgi:hypothetical protein